MSTRNIMSENVPAWYKLGFSDGCILIYIYRVAFDFIVGFMKPSNPIVSGYQGVLGIPAFIEPTEKKWGFGKVLVFKESDDPNWVVLECKLPVIFPKRSSVKWEAAYATSITLSVLFDLLSIFEQETNSKHPQILTVSDLGIYKRSDLGGIACSVVVCLSAHCRLWLQKQEKNNLSQIQERICNAMMLAHKYMHKLYSPDKEEFQVLFREPGLISLSCDRMSAVDISPEERSDFLPKIGYWLTPHNIDSPLHQLVLLAGAADLCKIVSDNFKNVP